MWRDIPSAGNDSLSLRRVVPVGRLPPELLQHEGSSSGGNLRHLSNVARACYGIRKNLPSPPPGKALNACEHYPEDKQLTGIFLCWVNPHFVVWSFVSCLCLCCIVVLQRHFVGEDTGISPINLLSRPHPQTDDLVDTSLYFDKLCWGSSYKNWMQFFLLSCPMSWELGYGTSKNISLWSPPSGRCSHPGASGGQSGSLGNSWQLHPVEQKHRHSPQACDRLL